MLDTELIQAEKKVQKIILEKVRPSEWVRIDNSLVKIEDNDRIVKIEDFLARPYEGRITPLSR